MASLDAHQWNCTGCREGSTAPSRHNHEKGSCKWFFDPNQAATNVNPHSKPMSSVDTPVDSSFLARVVAENRDRRPVETVFDYDPAEDDNVSVAASESAPDLSCFAVADEREETEPAPASTPPLRRSRRVPARRATARTGCRGTTGAIGTSRSRLRFGRAPSCRVARGRPVSLDPALLHRQLHLKPVGGERGRCGRACGTLVDPRTNTYLMFATVAPPDEPE